MGRLVSPKSELPELQCAALHGHDQLLAIRRKLNPVGAEHTQILHPGKQGSGLGIPDLAGQIHRTGRHEFPVCTESGIPQWSIMAGQFENFTVRAPNTGRLVR